MRIAIPLNGDSLESDLCLSSEGAPFCAIFNATNEQCVIVPNPAVNTSSDPSLVFMLFLNDQAVEALIALRCSQESAELFDATDLMVYQAVSTSVEDNLTALHSGQLDGMKRFLVAYHGNE